jgi:hypothetical protein
MASQEELDRLKELRDLERELAGIRSDTLNDVRDMSNFLSDSAASLKLQVAERNQIRSISRQINKIAQESYTISLSELGTSKNLAKIQGDRESLQKKITSLTQLQETLSKSEDENQKNIAENISFQVEETQKLLAELKEVETESAQIKNNLGVRGFAVAEDIAGAIPGLRQFKGTFSDAADAARGIAVSGGNAAQAFAAGAKSISKAAVAALPLLVFTQILKAVLQIDKSSGEIAKNLGISYDEALALNKEFTQIAASSDNIFITTQNLGEAFLSINSALGTNSTLSSDLLTTQTELVKQAGYSVEAATQLATLSLATGKSSKDITTEFLGQLTLLNLQNQSSINEKVALEDIAKISKATLATFAAQPRELASAVFQAKRLGLQLSQLESIQEGLLDIESSLRAEFVAETVLGRQLELGLARRAALTNDLLGLGEELEKQKITLKEFDDLNFIQQDALANALRIQRGELGQMLLQRTALLNLSDQEGASAQERFNNLVKQTDLETARAQIGDKTLANQLASVNVQERFNQSISKLTELFVQIAEPLLPILSGIASVLEVLIPLIPSIAFIAGVFTGNPLLIGLGGTGILGQIDAMDLSGVEDGIAPASKGPFTITDSYGNMAITAKGDSLAVSPNIELNNRPLNPGTRNTNERNTSEIILSDTQLNRLADFISKGAERGTSKAKLSLNVDGRRLADSQQVPSILGQYRFSS